MLGEDAMILDDLIVIDAVAGDNANADLRNQLDIIIGP